MTGLELYTLNQGLLSGQIIDETMFYQLLNMKKDILEMSRDWMILRAFDSTIIFATSDDYTSSKTLPDRFLRPYTLFKQGIAQPGVFLVTSQGSKIPLSPIPFSERFDTKDSEGFFYIDRKNNKIGRTGLTAGTLHLYFLQGTEDIDADRTWEFPSFAHPLLPYEVAIEQKGGIDWDTVNANQVPFNRNTAAEIKAALAMWDARLQQSELGV